MKKIICKIFGHRFNTEPTHEWCARCGLAYEEIVYLATGKNYYEVLIEKEQRADQLLAEQEKK